MESVMPKYRIKGNMGYVGTDWEDYVEAEDMKDATKYAEDYALERIEFSAEEITDEEYEKEGGY